MFLNMAKNKEFISLYLRYFNFGCHTSFDLLRVFHISVHIKYRIFSMTHQQICTYEMQYDGCHKWNKILILPEYTRSPGSQDSYVFYDYVSNVNLFACSSSSLLIHSNIRTFFHMTRTHPCFLLVHIHTARNIISIKMAPATHPVPMR